MKIQSDTNQLWWVVLLLAVAVILPTVCLLWFMTQAVKNEHLAVRQKLVDVCEDLAQRSERASNQFWSDLNSTFLKSLAEEPEVDMFYAMTFSGHLADGAIICKGDEIVYPSEENITGEETSDKLEEGWELEFQQQDYPSAVEFYKKIISDSNDELTYRKAQMGLARCSTKLGKIDDAINYCREIAFTDMDGGSGGRSFGQIGQIRANASLLLAQLFEENKDTQPERFAEHLRNVFATVDHYASQNPGYRELLSSQRIFIYKQAMAIYQRNKDLPKDIFAHHIDLASRMAQAEELSSGVAEDNYYQLRQSNADGKAYAIPDKPNIYFAKYSVGRDSCILLFEKETLLSHFERWQQEFLQSSPFNWRIVDITGRYVAGVLNSSHRPLFSSSMGLYTPTWRLELFLKEQTAFDKTAKSQTTVYVWTAMLVIILMLTSGGIAIQAIGKQIKLNRLKNDFIATVTHELKTPLSSMRVLVDTLLEGRYEEQKQATEYLQLISKENKRLSHLIDNFLTFSRMERNKRAFEFEKVRPADIAKAAAEAVSTKFSKDNCKFAVNIEDNLPSILVDKDAMVTVLVNLLDNAYKYSEDEKWIDLRVFAEDGRVCFSIKDNGVGLSRRAMKKIFNRFYQTDRSLSRRAEGTGLGLSIVKFIVDAHKGTIDVDSKPGKGSAFTVKIPVNV